MTGVLEKAAELTKAVARVVRPLGPEADLVRRYWDGQAEPKLRLMPELGGAVLSSMCVGLGDTLMLTDIPRASKGQVPVFSTSKHFRPLMRFNEWWREPLPEDQLMLANAPTLVRYYATGNGHYLQRLRRAFKLPVEPVARGCVKWQGRRANNRVLMHFEAGPHALWQRQHITPGARLLSPWGRSMVEKWVASMKGWEFWMVGAAPPGGPLKGVQMKRSPSLAELVELTGQCGWFVGIVSGVMHLATAMQLKCVVLVDFPHAHEIMLPTLKQTDQLEAEWLYHQNVHLHQFEEGPLVKRVTVENLKRAVDGDLYPHWRTDYGELIFEGTKAVASKRAVRPESKEALRKNAWRWRKPAGKEAKHESAVDQSGAADGQEEVVRAGELLEVAGALLAATRSGGAREQGGGVLGEPQGGVELDREQQGALDAHHGGRREAVGTAPGDDGAALSGRAGGRAGEPGDVGVRAGVGDGADVAECADAGCGAGGSCAECLPGAESGV